MNSVQGVSPRRAQRKGVENGALKRDGSVLICPNREIALRVLPEEKDRRYRFVDTRAIPDVKIGRDVGNPHWCLGWLIRRTHLMVNHPEIMEEYKMRPKTIGAGMFRRLGGTVANFHRLDREACAQVLDKKIDLDHHIAVTNGHSAEELKASIIHQIVSWLWSPNG